jgi:hypothetical protein
MDWPFVTALISIVMGLVGFCLMGFVFVKLARDVRWKQAYLSAEQAGRWSFPHRLAMTGVILAALFVLGVMMQLLIRGRFP